jgi:hypothetical protein
LTLALERLEVSFKWEVRTLWTVPIGVVVFFINRPAGHAFGALGALSTLVMDTLFSVIVIATFLRPINKVLHRNQHALEIGDVVNFEDDANTDNVVQVRELVFTVLVLIFLTEFVLTVLNSLTTDISYFEVVLTVLLFPSFPPSFLNLSVLSSPKFPSFLHSFLPSFCLLPFKFPSFT